VVLAYLLTQVHEKRRPSALWLRGALIIGSLNLEAAELVCPMVLEGCWFEQPINLTSARTRALWLTGCHLPALHAQELTTRGNVHLNDGFVVQGDVYLAGAQVGGQLILIRARINNPNGYALYAEDLTVDRGVYCRDGFHAEGEVLLRGARIGGSLDFNGAELTNPNGYALNAEGVTVTHRMACGRGFTAQGKVNLRSARIGGALNLDGGTLTSSNGYALNADGLTVGDMLCRNEDASRKFSAKGLISLVGAEIRGQLSFKGAELMNPTGRALYADSLTVGQDMHCTEGFTADGEVRLVGAHIGGGLGFAGAKLTNPNGLALSGQRITVDRDMQCSMGFSAHGEVNLLGAHVRGQLAFVEATLVNPNGRALHLQELRAESLLLRPVEPPSLVDLTHAHVGVLLDDPRTWPSKVHLRGFTYDSIYEQPAVKARRRLEDWVGRDPDGYVPQPYEQLAAAYRRAGREQDARQVGITKQRARRRQLSPPARVGSLLLDMLVGYGFRTWLAAVWLVAWATVGTLVFAAAYPSHMTLAKPSEPHPLFQPAVYSLDVLLPVVDLKQEAVWIPRGTARLWAWCSVLVGWALTTVVISALSGILKRE
jgi:hypothetical protein